MADHEGRDELVGLLVGAANAHHEATGGDSDDWANWYADHLIHDVNRLLGTHLKVRQLESWLASADDRYRSQPQDVSWPKAYASWLRSDFSGPE